MSEVTSPYLAGSLSSPLTPSTTIRDCLTLLFEPGDTFEIRCLAVKEYDKQYGYFRDFDKAVNAATRIDDFETFKGIYAVINPVKPDYFYRCKDRLQKVERNSTTGDAGVVKRRWLYIDLDPERVSDISSSDLELQAAENLVPLITGYLSKNGFKEPIVAHSGNGYHILYRVDLPNSDDSTHLIKTILEHLNDVFTSSSSDDGIGVKVDTSVHNASRLIRIWGTINRKGDNDPERPHRRSGIIKIPDSVEITPLEVLQALVPQEDKPQETLQAHSTPGNFKAVTEYLDAWRLKYSKPIDKGTYWLYTLEQCPFCDDHSSGAIVTQQKDNGAISAKCHHERCGALKQRWQELREKYEKKYPTQAESKSTDPIVQNASTVAQKPANNFTYQTEDELPVSTTLDTKELKLEIHLPEDHFVSRYVSFWSGRNDSYPDYSYATALILLSIAANGTLYIPIRNTANSISTNLWIMNLGVSSFSRKTTSSNAGRRLVASNPDEIFHEAPSLSSPEGFVEYLDGNPHCYLFKDECAQILGAINKKTYMQDMRDLLCSVYDGTTITRKLRTSKKAEKTEYTILEPYFVQLLSTTQDNFRQNCTSLDVSSGWLLRFLYVNPRYDKAYKPLEIGTSLDIVQLNKLSEEFNRIVSVMNRLNKIACIPSESGMLAFNVWVESTHKSLKGHDYQGVFESMLGRINLYVLKIAALLQLGDHETLIELGLPGIGFDEMYIEDEYMLESIRIVRDYFYPISCEIVQELSEIEDKNTQLTISRHLKAAPHMRMEKSQLLRKLKMKTKDVTEHLEAMEEQGLITIDYIPGLNGKIKTIIRMV